MLDEDSYCGGEEFIKTTTYLVAPSEQFQYDGSCKLLLLERFYSLNRNELPKHTIEMNQLVMTDKIRPLRTTHCLFGNREE